MARLLQCSVPTVQAVELGRLQLSERLAARLAQQTDVCLSWLLTNDVSKPCVDVHQQPFKRDSYERRQAELCSVKTDPNQWKSDLALAQNGFANMVHALALLYSNALRDGNARLMHWKIHQAMWERTAKLLEPDRFKKLTHEEIDRLAKIRAGFYQAKDLVGVIDGFLADTEHTCRVNVEKLEPAPPPPPPPTPPPAARPAKGKKPRR